MSASDPDPAAAPPPASPNAGDGTATATTAGAAPVGRGTRWALALLVALFVGLSLNASVLTPLFEAPGESEHLAVSQHWARHGRAPDLERDIWLPPDQAVQPPLAAWIHALGLTALDLADVDFLRRPSADPPSAHDALRWMHGADERRPWSHPVRDLHLVRLLGLLAGVATLLGTYQLARRAAPGRPAVALGAAALAALHPLFLQRTAMISAVPWATAATTWGLVAVADLATRPRLGGWHAFLLGLLLGVAQVTDRTALLLLPLAALAVLLRRARAGGWREVLTGWDRMLAGYVVVTVAWYAHDLSAAGRLFPPAPGFDAGLAGAGDPLARRLAYLVTVVFEHWRDYAPGRHMGLPALTAWAVVLVGGLAGMLFRGRGRGELDLRVWALFSVAWLANVGLAAAPVAWLPDVSLYLTLGPLACVLAAGWSTWLPRWLGVIGIAALAALAFQSQYQVLGPSHWPRERVDDPHFVITDPFEAGPDRKRVEAIAWTSPADGSLHRAAPELRWEAASDLRARYTVHLVAPVQRLRLRSYEDHGLACRDRFDVPRSFWDALPTGAWVVAQVFRLPHRDEILPGARFEGVLQQSPPRELQRVRPEDDI